MTRDFSDALAKATAWMGGGIAGVVGVAPGTQPDGSPCIVVLVNPNDDTGQLPSDVDGYPVQVLDTGGDVNAQRR
ncbi:MULTISPECIES: hypothetical protein [Streptomyces]|uniref:Uncharacterized protein n=1 Tax=Streptomyces chartreusis NRRL 3882 TaxID=1079985 RepID=A0A2N9B020_STRCX|nr:MULTISPECIES: hypothetical protein [Streptomyces]MYS91962.1 hypothetical protein [Streptomyces sp. SID5464]SOR76677.1 hypothetical protein SCNRRL3882_0160 [Streptomyces chartreusis NRRL 3882]